MDAFTLVSFTLTLLMVAAIPGPGVFTTVATALSSGLGAALLIIAGIVAGHLVFLMFAVFGLTLTAHLLGDLFIWVKTLGGLYLLWLGARLCFSQSSQSASQPPRTFLKNSNQMLKGLVVTFSNPKAILFYCSLFPTLVTSASLSIPELATLTFIVTLVFSFVLTCYAYMAHRARTYFSDPQAIKRLNRIAGGMMIAAGGGILAKN